MTFEINETEKIWILTKNNNRLKSSLAKSYSAIVLTKDLNIRETYTNDGILNSFPHLEGICVNIKAANIHYLRVTRKVNKI